MEIKSEKEKDKLYVIVITRFYMVFNHGFLDIYLQILAIVSYILKKIYNDNNLFLQSNNFIFDYLLNVSLNFMKIILTMDKIIKLINYTYICF